MVKSTDYIFQITEYIKKNLKKGYPTEILRQALIDQGHSKLSIEKAFRIVERDLIKNAPKLKTKPLITRKVYPDSIKDLFD